jgi:outer membrane receptor protein involved in Fe transport
MDSHSVVTRLLGLPSAVLGSRLGDTAFSQYGGRARLVYHATGSDSLSFEYLRGTQLGASRYDQLDGGLGNLLHRFDPQVLDFVVVRYDRMKLAFLDSFSAGFSFNGQRDDRRFQNVNNRQLGLHSNITDEHNKANVLGYQAQAGVHLGQRHVLVFGGEFYDEFISSQRIDLVFDPATSDYTSHRVVRARFPDDARYNTLGLFAQHTGQLITHRLVGSFGVRYSRFGYRQSADSNPLTPAGQPTVPNLRTTLDDTTFAFGLVYTLNQNVNLTGRVSRGFRAPNVNDLASIGISGIGFEVSPEEAVSRNATVARFGAASQGSNPPARPLQPEILYNYEVGVKVRTSRIAATVSLFDSEFTDFIERRIVLLPPGALGTSIGGQPIVRQDASGEVYTSLSNSPVFVRANAGHVRFRGLETSLWVRLARNLSLNANASCVRGTDVETKAPPAVENGIPPFEGFVGLRWEPSNRYWLEVYSLFADAQRRFSDNDLQQARIGGIRTRDEITNFFNNGAVARGLVRDGILVPTNENLDQVLSRVLGPDLSARVPLFAKNPGYATLNFRGGYQTSERTRVTLILENILDKNYRTMGSGVDSPGITVALSYSIRF